VSARADTRVRLLRRLLLGAALAAILALLFLAGGHWILGVVFGAAAVVAGWLYLQARAVR
jgi:hypothetical protein